MDKTLYLYPLLCALSPELVFHTPHSFATKSGANLAFCNRAGAVGDITTADIEQVEQYFARIPFTWFVGSGETASITTLQKSEYKKIISFPAMQMPLKDLPQASYSFDIRTIHSGDQFEDWLEIIVQSYNTNRDEFRSFMTYLREHALPGVLHWYLLYENDKPIAASVTIRSENIIALHWVGTIPSHRKKGYGYAISHHSIAQAYQQGCTDAVLFASEIGKPVYEKIGFKMYEDYLVFRK